MPTAQHWKLLVVLIHCSTSTHMTQWWFLLLLQTWIIAVIQTEFLGMLSATLLAAFPFGITTNIYKGHRGTVYITCSKIKMCVA